ncbi:MAG: Abi family protein [Defluviitaleaceae bacterium]|nr:Abi family protein [Defluviitaleaceae bacterium]
MGKKFKSLAFQIKRLRDKGVIIENEQLVKEVLLKSNYYHLTTCGKVKFAKSKGMDGKYIYEPSLFEDWVSYFELDCRLSEHLMINFIRFERGINAKTAYYVSELIESNTLTADKKNELKQKIKSAKKCFDYNLKQTWQYIPKMTFGELVYLLVWISKNEREIYLKIISDWDFLKKENRLYEINHLRNNALLHPRPLNIYLIYGNVNKIDLNQRKRIMIIYWLFRVERTINLEIYLKNMINNAKRFQKIKKQSVQEY